MAIRLVAPYRIELGAEFDPETDQWIVWGWISNADIPDGHREPIRWRIGFQTRESALAQCLARAKEMIRWHAIDGNLVDLELERRPLGTGLQPPS